MTCPLTLEYIPENVDHLRQDCVVRQHVFRRCLLLFWFYDCNTDRERCNTQNVGAA